MHKIGSLTGQTFGFLRVIALEPTRSVYGHAKWLVECVCGTRKLVETHSLVSGNTKSCGCKQGYSRIKDLTGQTFGFLTVLSLDSTKGLNGQTRWLCECVCKEVLLVRRDCLTSGSTKSCGCKTTYLRWQSNKKLGGNQPSNFRSLYFDYRGHARHRNIYFNLTMQQIKPLLQSNCHYCGIEPLRKAQKVNPKDPFLYNGIDRKDNNLGYTIDNVLPCCWTCNIAKMDRSYEEYLDWIARSARHIFLQNKEKQRG